MQIQVNTDSHVEGNAELTSEVESIVQQALGRFGDRITRVEVFFSDENSSEKSGERDKRCVIEARLGGLQPITVSHQGSSLDQALLGAAGRLEKTLNGPSAERMPSSCGESATARNCPPRAHNSSTMKMPGHKRSS